MQRSEGRRRGGRRQEWYDARPPADAGWPLRLRFLCIAVSIAFCSWAGMHALSGRLSFAWLPPLQQQAQALVAPLQSASRVSAFPTVGGTSSPLVQAVTSAHAVPMATVAPAVAAQAVIVVVTPRATPTAAAGVAAVRQSAATATEQTTRGVVATVTPATATLAPAALAALAAGPHTRYVVRAGDTLDGIARRFGVTAKVLAALNHLTPPYKIIQGKSLLIPEV